MAERIEVRIAGYGGQGVILAGVTLADAAVRDGHKVAQTQSYGPEARGGASRCEIIISGGEIDYPKVTKPDIFLALSQEAYDRYAQEADGDIVVDEGIDTGKRRVYRVPILKTAEQELRNKIVGNMVALGVLCGMTGIITEDSLISAVEERLAGKNLEANTKAVYRGIELGRLLKE